MKKFLAFSLMEMTIVLIIMGVIGFIGMRALPKMSTHMDAKERQAEFAIVEKEFITWLRQQNIAKLPRHYIGGYSYIEDTNEFPFVDSTGVKWGYLAAEALMNGDICAITDDYGMLTTAVHGTQIPLYSKHNVAAVLYSNDPVSLALRTKLAYGPSISEYELGVIPSDISPSPSTMAFTERENLTRVVTYPELKQMLGCPPQSTSISHSRVTELRPAQWDEPYDSHEINFADIDRSIYDLDYCIERSNLSTAYQISTDGGSNVPIHNEGYCTSNSLNYFRTNDLLHLHTDGAVAPEGPQVQHFKIYMRFTNSIAAPPTDGGIVYVRDFMLTTNKKVAPVPW